MLSREQAIAMLRLQSGMNAKVDPNWVAAKYPYLRAVVIEGAEAIEHHGWKWWKHQSKDLPQLQMELIDIWHFLLSQILLNHYGNEDKALVSLLELLEQARRQTDIEFDNRHYIPNSLDLVAKLELLIALAAARRIDLSIFEAIMADCEMDWTALYCQYVGKNVLNFFRQDNGYKQGHYLKVWHGREDNEYLVEVMAQLDASDPDYAEKLYSALQHHYPA
jgi:hypothetical protein